MRRKPRLVEQAAHGPFKADIRLDSSTGVFSCEFGSQQFSSQILPEVRTWARQTLRGLCELQWQPVMAVNFDNEDTRVNDLKNTSNILCYIERFHIAWDGKKWVRCPWVVMPSGTVLCVGPADSEMDQNEYPVGEDDLRAERVRLSEEWNEAKTLNITWPIVSEAGCNTNVYYVQYTEERWQTMLGILDKIRELRAGINRLLSSEQGWIQLAVVAQARMLTDQKSPETASEPTSAEPKPAEARAAGRSATRYSR